MINNLKAVSITDADQKETKLKYEQIISKNSLDEYLTKISVSFNNLKLE